MAAQTLRWTDVQQIGEWLADHHPERDPLTINFVDLRQLVLAIPTFADRADGCNERILEAIQMCWLEERDG